ncbi:MAG: protein-disulfide reductase DsbD domain-containing protein [Roseovarius sp.]
MKPILRAFALAAALLIAPLAAVAQDLSDVVSAKLLPGWRSADGTHMAGLEITLAPGWKTYWRAPGDAGIPPQFDWRASRNLSGAEIRWPVPKRVDQDGMITIGYSGTVVLPLHLTPSRTGHDITLSGQVSMGVCEDVCIPVDLTLTAILPKDATARDPRIAAALANRPYTKKEAGVSGVSCAISAGKDGALKLTAQMRLSDTGRDEMVVVETDNPKVWVAPATSTRSGNTLTAKTELVHVDGSSFALNRQGIRITVLGGSRMVDIKGCPAG